MLRSRRLRFIPLREGDVPFLLSHWNRPEVRRFLFNDRAVPEEEVRSLLRRSWADERVNGYALYRLELSATKETVGVAGIRFVALTSAPELVYSLEPPYWGLGFATEAARRLIRLAKETKQPFILAGVDPGNEASNQVLRKAGLKPLRRLLGVDYLGKRFTRRAPRPTTPPKARQKAPR